MADNSLAVVMAERKRSSFSKITHLADEVGDSIQIKHPITELPIKVFAVNLKRTLTMSKSGGIFDRISGWRL